MLLDENDITYVCISVMKKGGRITGLRLLHIPSFQDCGTYELEYIYQSKIPVFNVVVVPEKLKSGKTRLTAVGTHGDINRYPVMDDNGEVVFSRALTIVATVQYEVEKKFTRWLVGGDFVEETRKVLSTYYILSTYEGCVGLMSEEQALQLAIRYHISNAAIAGRHLRALYLKDVTKPEFIEICESDKDQVDQGAFIRRMTNMDSANASNMQELIDFIVKSQMVPLTEEQSRRCRVLGDTVRSKQFRKGAFGLSEKDVRDINRYVDRVIMWNYLQENCLKFMLQMYDKVCASDAQMARMFGLDKDPDFKSIGLRAAFSTLKTPVDKLYNMQSFANLSGEARATYCTVLRQEPQMTSLMKLVSKTVGGSLAGLEYRIKSPSSYTEKVFERERIAGHNVKEACDNITDILRYTILFECSDTEDRYVEKTDSLVRFLRSVQKHSLLYFRNYWCVTRNPYNGINTGFRLPDAVIKYELQVHTPESFEVKNGALHKLYEEARAISTTNERRAALNTEMESISKNMRFPADVLSFRVSIWKDYSKKDTNGY